jgi:ketosteroid isomerase-like protein
VNTKTGLLILLLLGLGPHATTHAQSLLSDEEVVRQLDDQMRIAVLNDDWQALERLLSEQFTVNAPVNRLVSGRSAVLELIRQAPRESFERTIEYLRVDGDFGIIMGAEIVRSIGGAPLTGQTVRRRFTNIWRKEAGTWRMVARHASVITPN